MPLLILAVASFLLFPIIVSLLCLADRLEARERLRRAHPVVPDSDTAFPLSITEAFDPVFAPLWEAPIAALELADRGGGAGIATASLRHIYHRAAHRFPEIYEGSTFASWLRFLEGTGLIARSGPLVTLTADGHAFLKFHFVASSHVEV